MYDKRKGRLAYGVGGLKPADKLKKQPLPEDKLYKFLGSYMTLPDVEQKETKPAVEKGKPAKPGPEEAAGKPEKGEAVVSSRDKDTGITTTIRQKPDGSRTVTETITDANGTQHIYEADNKGKETYTKIEPDGTKTVTKDDEYGYTVTETYYPDGRVVRKNIDGTSTETVPGDGYKFLVKRNARGEVTETAYEYDDGATVRRIPEAGGTEIIKTQKRDDGTTMTCRTDQYGNETKTVTDATGRVVSEEKNIVKPKDAGQDYYETRIAPVTGGRWDELPESMKIQMANSERDIQRREAEEALQTKLDAERVRARAP